MTKTQTKQTRQLKPQDPELRGLVQRYMEWINRIRLQDAARELAGLEGSLIMRAEILEGVVRKDPALVSDVSGFLKEIAETDSNVALQLRRLRLKIGCVLES